MKNLFEKAKEFNNIVETIKLGNMPNALLIICPDSESCNEFARQIIFSFFCESHTSCGHCEGCIKNEKQTNPDLLVFPKEKIFQVNDAKEIVDSSIVSPMIFDNKIYLIKDIDNSTIAAQNKILKVLEEPPSSVKFILTATNETKVLPTIQSRCVKVNLQPSDKETLMEFLSDNQITEQSFEEAYEYGEGFLGKTLFALDNKNFHELNLLANSVINELKSSKQIISFSSKIAKNKENFLIILHLLQIKFRNMLKQNIEGYSKTCLIYILDEIFKIQKEVENNVSQNLQADNLLMKILEFKYLYK